MKHLLFTLALGACISACSGKSAPTPTSPSPTTPTAPSPAPSPTTPTKIIALSGSLAFGNVEVSKTSDLTFTIGNSGTATLTVTGITGPSASYSASWSSGTIPANGSQQVSVRFTPTAEQTYNGTMTVNGDHTSGTNTTSISGTGTRPAGPRTSFGAGTYLVGSDIAPARYFSDPNSGCYWERLSGLGGSLGEILANDFVGFNAGQSIVDILSGDRAFKTDSECGTWFQTQRRGLQADITPGVWLVGSQLTAGTYRANAASGCYWERMRHFQGNLDGIIANDFVSSAGQQLVEIRASDAGFQSDSDCGTWTRAASLTPALQDMNRRQSLSEIESNRQMHRRGNRVR